VSVVVGTRPPLWRNVRVLRIAGQVAFVAAVVIVLREMFLNAAFNLGERGTDLTFGFLDSRAGFDIKESVFNYSANQDFLRAFMVGATNAMLVAAAGIVLATLLGLTIGVARLSPNWLLRRITQVYVEVFRNVPLLVQLVFWYVAVILAIPQIGRSLSLFGLAFASNRGAAIPALRPGEGFAIWGAFVLAGAVVAALTWRWRTAVNERSGRPSYRTTASLAALVLVCAAGYLIVGDAFSIEVPEVGERSYVGGLQMSPEFAGILLALVVYTAAFIGEIVRGSILSVAKGQKEAAQALGLRPGQQLRLVVLPQALRTAVPPINNQYLNLWKNTSLAFAVGYPELVNISTTMINQAGHELQIFSMVVITYLATSLVISLVMNVVNRVVALRGGR
jgi:general L-amino acid transport system permease protein